jgi:hypothetical protein
LSNLYTPGSGSSGSSSNSSSFVSRRDIRASHVTGALPVVSSPAKTYSTSSFDFEAMLVSLHELFEQDRQVASQSDATRCGICYLHFSVSKLHYRDQEGFYVCDGCERSLGKQTISMLRQQQK